VDTPSQSHSSLIDALARLRKRSEATASGWRLLLYAAIFTPLLISSRPFLLGDLFEDYDLYLSREPYNTVLRASVLAALALIPGALVYGWVLSRDTRRRLEDSQLAIRIAGGELLEDPVFGAVPWPWRMLLPGRRRGSLYAGLARVAGNLDWYLRPRASLWRLQWLYQPCALAWFCTVAGMLWDGPPRIRHYPSWTILLTAMVMLPLAFIKFRRQVWTEELVRHLTGRLEQ
jgi:hypothetical protein